MSEQIQLKPFNKVLANWLINDFMAMCKKRKITPATSGISPLEFGTLIKFHHEGLIDRKKVRMMLEKWLDERPEFITKEQDEWKY